MPPLGSLHDATDSRLQDLRRNDWHELRTLLGQKVLSATHNELLDVERTAKSISQVHLLVAVRPTAHVLQIVLMQAHTEAAFSAFSNAVLEHMPDAQQPSSVANALLVAVLQSLACWKSHTNGTGSNTNVGQHVLSAINQADLSGAGHVQV